LAAAQAQVRMLQTQIGQTSVRAPYDGVITQRLLDPGAFAGPNQPVARISQIATVYVNVNVPDDNLGYVHTGTPITFTSSSLPNRTFRAAVMDVNATPTSGTLSYRARVRVPNPDNALRGGMLVSVVVRKEFHPGAIVVPRTAVFQSDTGTSVYTVAAAPAPPGGAPPAGGGAPPAGGAAAKGPPPPQIMKAVQVPVTVGLQTDTTAEIRSPQIGPGTTVITTRPDALRPDSLVAISPPAAGGAHGAQ
jgi:multidrug efflux pump subunit AcrA (membrane-fusion protein)